jgi:imidazolonepropionase-like amidohydrolase
VRVARRDRIGAITLAGLSLLLSAAAPSSPRHPRPGSPTTAANAADRGQTAWASRYVPLPRTDTLIVHARILDGAGGRFDDGSLLLRDGKIVSIGAAIAAPAGVTVIDAGGRWVTPGIIDVHSHDGTFVAPLTANESEFSDVSEIASPIAAGSWVEHSVNVQDPSFSRALRSGVTTLQTLPGSIPLIGGRSVILKPIPANTVAEMKFPGAQQGVKMSCGDNPRMHFGGKGGAPNSRMGEIEILRGIFARAKAEGRDRRGPGGPLDMQTLDGVLAGELPVHIHCYRADDIANMLNLAREFGFKITAVHHATEAYKIPRLLIDNGACAVLWSDWWGFKNEAADGIRANAAVVDAAGGCVALHSDSPLMGQRLNLEAAKAMAAGRRAGIAVTSEHAIRWITSNPAKILGLDDRIGTLLPGRNADLVLWSGDPFSVYSHADMVFVDGSKAFDRTDPSRQPQSDFELGRSPASRR